ncbi:MAG: hypothetical protein Kow00111_10410 [Thermincola ferriacetica]
MDSVHEAMTKSMVNSAPPRFSYEIVNEKTIIINYKSKRNLIQFLVGLIKGVGNYYKENLRVKLLNNNRVEVVFP